MLCDNGNGTMSPCVGKHMVWQPIETAPKDGTFVLLYEREQYGHREGGVFMAMWDKNKGCWMLCKCTDLDDELITHWMPLPDAPQ